MSNLAKTPEKPVNAVPPARVPEAVLEAIHQGRLAEGEEELKRILATHPECLDAWGHLAHLLFQQERLGEAAQCYDHCIHIAPGLIEAYCRKADCHFLLGEHAKARSTLRAVKGNPAYLSREVQGRLARSQPILWVLLVRGLRKLPALSSMLLDPGLARAILREIVLIPQSWRGIRDAGLYEFLLYFSQGFLENRVHHFPVSSCDLCGSRSARAVFFHKHRKFVRCSGCGLERVERMPPGGEDLHSGFYERDEVISEQEEEWHNPDSIEDRRRRLRSVFDEIGEVFPQPGKRAFELGCGQGHLLHYLQSAGMTTAGIDASRKLVDFCRQRFGLDVHTSTVADVETPDEPYDFVFAYHVIEHLDHPSLIFEKARALLRENGHLFIETPVPDLSRASPRDKRHESLGYGSSEHMHFFTPDTLARYFEKYGFDLLNTYQFLAGTLPNGGFLGRKR